MGTKEKKPERMSRLQAEIKGEKIVKKLLLIAFFFIPLTGCATSQESLNQTVSMLSPEQKQKLAYDILQAKIQQSTRPIQTYQAYVPPEPPKQQSFYCYQSGAETYCNSY